MDYGAAYGGGDEFTVEGLYFYDDEEQGSIPVPNADRTEIIQIEYENLPSVGEVINMLVNERAALSYWVRIAIFYYKQKRYEDFVKLLETASQAEYRPGNEKDRVRALDMLAAYYVQCGNQEKDKDARRSWFDKATVLYAMADRVSRYDQNHLIGRAHFCLLEGKTEQEADIQLDFVLKQLAPNNVIDERLMVPACMGKAVIMYMRKDYKSSLEYFKKCLQASPNCPAFIRLGIGYCLVKLGKIEKAKIAFERCIELDPENIDAQAALAVLQVTSPQSPEESRAGIVTLGALYKKDKDHPLILNHLANYFFTKSELDENADKVALLNKAKALLDRVLLISSKNEQILAECNFHLARFYHAQDKIVDAHRHYYQSCQYNHPKFVLPFYGYGQTSIFMKDTEKAIESFEKVLKAHPNNTDTLKILGALYARSSTSETTDKKLAAERKEKARKFLTKASEASPDDIDVLFDLAVLLQHTEFGTALQVYEKIIKKLDEHNFEVPAEIYNNIGILHYRVKNFMQARQAFLDCREILVKTDPMDDKTKAELIVLSFNLARVDEKLSNFIEAERIYKGILKKRSNYTDALFRLACMYYNRNDMDAAMSVCKELTEQNPNNPDPWILFGNIHFDLNQLNHAQKKYEHVLKMSKGSSVDPLALVAMGNVWLKMLFDVNRNREKDQIHRDRAISYYLKALRVNPHNVYAAHGAGCILAQRGETTSAYDVFGQVRENVTDYPDVWLNIANCQLDMGHFTQAAQLYQTYLHRFSTGNRAEIYINTAFALYKTGQVQKSLDFLARALTEEPNNHMLLYNHAFVTMKYASDMLKSEYSKLDEVNHAVEGLEMAESVFKSISKMPVEEVQPYRYLSRTQCAELARQCADLLRQSADFRTRAERKHRAEIELREKQEAERLRVLEEQKMLAQKKAEEEAMRLEELRLKRRFFIEQTKEALKAVKVEDEPKRSAAGGSRKRRKQQKRPADDEDDIINDDMSADEDEKTRRKKNKALARKMDKEFIDDGDGRPSKRGKKKERFAEEDPGQFKGKIKSRAIVEDTSSSSESDAEAANAPTGRSSAEVEFEAQQRAIGNLTDSSDDSDAADRPSPKKKAAKKTDSSDEDSDAPAKSPPRDPFGSDDSD